MGVDPNGGLSSVQQGVMQPTYTLYAAFAASPGIAFAWTGGTPGRPVWQRRHAAVRGRPARPGHRDAEVGVDHARRQHHRCLPGRHGQRPPRVVAHAAGLTSRWARRRNASTGVGCAARTQRP